MVAFRDHTLHSPPSPLRTIPSSTSPALEENEELVQFYFQMFDFDHSGSIGLDELKLVIRCICSDGGGGSDGGLSLDERDVEAMFEAMAVKKNCTIDYEEFKRFYLALLVQHASSTRSRV
jgi:Ca2+-binding EF-hand superfamily protein